jgi:Cd2+/Zn2+-exporting ATPase
MLVAFASFVLHGSAMARVIPMHSGSSAGSHQHDHAAHDHAGHDHGPAHTHAAADHYHDDSRDGAEHHGATGACCGSFCATALMPFARHAAVSRVETSAALPSYEADGHGIGQEGPRKPPRTPDIA